MAAELVTQAEIEQEFDQERFFAQIPEPMEDVESFELPRLQKVGERIYGVENWPTLDALGKESLGRILGGVAGMFVEHSFREEVGKERVSIVADNLRGLSDFEIAMRLDKAEKTMPTYRSSTIAGFRALSPRLHIVVDAVGGTMLAPAERPLRTQQPKIEKKLETEVEDQPKNLVKGELTAGGLVLLRNLFKGRQGQDWVARARCAQGESYIFSVKALAEAQRAIQICQTCPVLQDCLYEGLVSNVKNAGVYGGMTEYQRNVYVRQVNTKAIELGLV